MCVWRNKKGMRTMSSIIANTVFDSPGPCLKSWNAFKRSNLSCENHSFTLPFGIAHIRYRNFRKPQFKASYHTLSREPGCFSYALPELTEVEGLFQDVVNSIGNVVSYHKFEYQR